MENPVTQDIITQYQRAFKIIHLEIEGFDDDQWLKGMDHFLVPVNVAMHIADTLDFYFSSGITGEEYQWGQYFGGGWWELSESQKPSREKLLTYLDEVEERVMDLLAGLDDQILLQKLPRNEHPTSYIGHLIYAIRHTMHHHGELGALSVFHGNPGGVWDDRV